MQFPIFPHSLFLACNGGPNKALQPTPKSGAAEFNRYMP